MILSGDTRQHGAVAASDALRAIEKHSGLKPAVIHQIRRQDPKLGASASERRFIREYRAAVKAAAKGRVLESFDRLDRIGGVRELAPAERRDAIAAEYRAALGRKEKPLVVAQTREETRSVNDAIREKLCATGAIGVGRTLRTFQPVDLGEAEKRDARFYQAGQHACFLRSYGRFRKGDVCEIVRADKQGLVVAKESRETAVSYRYADRFTVAKSADMKIAKGDRLQLKFNGKSAEGARLNNGELVTVRRVKRSGALVVQGDDGVRKTLSPSQRVLQRGYAVTSYGSQGKTVDSVIFSDGTNRAATSAEQWYVTISRGRKRVVVFTSDKEALRTNVERAGARELAVDLKLETPASSALKVSEWTRRSLAVVERLRQHNAVMARQRAGEKNQRIKL